MNLSQRTENIPESRRTITEVLDVQTGEIIKSEDFFKQPEAIIIKYRRELQKSIMGLAPKKFVCPMCGQMLKLSGRKTERGKVNFFSHLNGSEDCEQKASRNFSKEEIEALKYKAQPESDRHKTLKEFIATRLRSEKSQDIGVRDVEVEKRIVSDLPYMNWRQPDVSANFNDKKIVFEIQLSTTFLSVIIERDIFYRHHGIYIIWVFNFSKNTKYVNLQNLMCKDIYYANKRNIFILDDTAKQMSIEKDELVLNCTWFEPNVSENGEYVPDNPIKRQKFVTLNNLSFDTEVCKPYFYNAELRFAKYEKDIHKKLYESEYDILQLLHQRIQEQRVRTNESLKLQENVKALTEQFEIGNINAYRYKKRNKYGYRIEDTVVIPEKYSVADEFGEVKFERVKKGR